MINDAHNYYSLNEHMNLDWKYTLHTQNKSISHWIWNREHHVQKNRHEIWIGNTEKSRSQKKMVMQIEIDKKNILRPRRVPAPKFLLPLCFAYWIFLDTQDGGVLFSSLTRPETRRTDIHANHEITKH
jgi:hypothetical protein